MTLQLFNCKTGLTTAAVSELARADWPSLRCISFSPNDVKAVAVLLGLDPDKVQVPNFDAYEFAKMHQRNVV